MTPERWERIQEWFDRLADLPLERRRHELDRIGASDPELRREVEALLASGEKAGDFVKQAVGAGSSPSDSLTEGRRDRVGQTISHYRIEKRLGGGGMGVVYRAQDLRLDRFVALKFLPPATDDDDERIKRLILEARAASALDHPNICTIHQIDRTDDGHWFIVMAYYNGETLKKRIERSPLAVPDVLDLGTQIMYGLVKAHKEGIVHRDLKPANLMVTSEGVVKIVDFGLAQLREQTKLTAPGTRLGTPAYMSPEQAQGQALDHRTDIWSLGVVFYEMLAGRPPFKGEYELAVIYSIVNEEPPPLDQIRPDTPTALLKAVKRALSKDPADRYQHVEELLHEIEKIKGNKFVAADPATVVAPPTGNPRRFLYTVLAAAAAVTIAVLLGILMRPDGSGQPAEPPSIASAPDPVTPAPSTPEQATPEQVAPEQVAPEQATSAPAAAVPREVPRVQQGVPVTSAKTPRPESEKAVRPTRPAPTSPAVPAPSPSTAQPQPPAAPETSLGRPAEATLQQQPVQQQPVQQQPVQQQPVQQQAPPVNPAALELADWTRIRESRDVAAFEAFLRSHPNGSLRREAQSSIEELQWETARAANNMAALERYLREYPNSRYAGQARARLEELRPPPAPAPVAKVEPPRAPPEGDAIRDVLKRYGEAYRARDAQQVAALWPTLTQEQVRRLADSFRVAVSIQQDLVPLADPIIRGDQATVRCRRLIRYADERGPQRPVDNEVNVALRKREGSWVIEAVN